MKARVNETTGEVLSIGEGKYSTDGPDVIVYNGDIPEGVDIIDMSYVDGAITNDPSNPRATAEVTAKGVRNARRDRLRIDIEDPSLRSGAPGLQEKIDDIINTLKEDGQLEDES